jgi:hypothetical protein
VRLGVHAQKLPVRGHEFGAEQVVDREAVLADEEADSSAERQPADPDRAGVAEGRRQAVLRCGVRVAAGCYTAAHPSRAALDVDLQPGQIAQVEHDPALGRAVARNAVAAAPDRELDTGLSRERDHPRDVVRVGCADDRPGPAVDSSVEDRATFVIAGLSGRRDFSVEVCSELRNRNGSCRS